MRSPPSQVGYHRNNGPSVFQPIGLMRKNVMSPSSVSLHPGTQILAGLPANGLVIQTDDPNLAFGDDASVSAVDACSGLEVEVVSHRTSDGILFSGIG